MDYTHAALMSLNRLFRLQENSLPHPTHRSNIRNASGNLGKHHAHILLISTAFRCQTKTVRNGCNFRQTKNSISSLIVHLKLFLNGNFDYCPCVCCVFLSVSPWTVSRPVYSVRVDTCKYRLIYWLVFVSQLLHESDSLQLISSLEMLHYIKNGSGDGDD